MISGKLGRLIAVAAMLALAALALAACSGCAVTRISSPQFSATRISFFTDFRAKGFKISQTPSGQPIVEWISLDNAESEGGAKAVKAAVEGAL
jgi:hypothetical protein